MTTQLPPLPFPAPVNPVARALNGVASEARRNAIAVDSLPTLLEGVAALAALAPFDPNESALCAFSPNSNDKVRYTILDNVLALTGPFVFRPSSVEWPTRPEEFSEALLPAHPYSATHDRRINSEFLAAQLTAAGANPWLMDGTPQATLPDALRSTLRFNMHQLLHRFLDCPHAWTAQAVWDAEVPTSYMKTGAAWEFMVEHNAANAMATLVARGARMEATPAWEDALKRAPANVAESLILVLGKPVPAAAAKRIQKAWQERLKGKQLSPAEVTQMVNALSPGQHALSEAEAEIQQRLATPWGEKPNGSSARGWGYCTNQGAEKLNEIAQVEKGPMAGQWTVLAAQVMARIRSASNRLSSEEGAYEWDVDAMVGKDEDHEGSIKPGIGLEWRPGISLDGLLMLGLVGQMREGSPTHMKALFAQQSKAMEANQPSALKTFAKAAGIEDIQAWCRASAESAARFTAACLRTPSVKAAQAFLHTWKRALTTDQDLLKDVSPEVRLELISALHARFGLVQLTSVKEFESVAYAIAEVDAKTLATLKSEDADKRSLALEVALACVDLVGPSVTYEALKQHNHLTANECDRVETWLEAQSKKVNKTAYNALGSPIREWLLDVRLPSQPINQAPKPRF